MQTTIELKLVPDGKTEDKIVEIMRRDTKIIKRVLGIMQQEKSDIFSQSKSGKWRTSRRILSEYMISTKNYSNPRYDLKQEFITISHNELMECIDNATEMYIAHLNQKEKTQKNASKPRLRSTISRRIGYRRFDINLENSTLSTMYSCKTNLVIARGIQSRVLHDKITMKFIPNSRAEEYLTLGEAKAMEFVQKKGRYYAHITVEIETPTYQPESGQLGVIGVDLGIKKTATAVLYVNGNIYDKTILNDTEIKQSYLRLEKRIAKLQQLLAQRDSYRYLRFFHYMAEKVGYGSLSQYLLHLNRQIKQGTVKSKMVKPALKLAQDQGVNPKYQHRVIRVLNELQDVTDKDLLDKTQNLRASLRRLKKSRVDLKDDMIKQLCHELTTFIQNHATSYDLYVVIGKPNGIQYRHRRGSGNKWLRKKINRWAFFKFQMQLKHNMTKIGMEKRLIEVNEAWTSKLCFRCNKRGVRPHQEIFYCSNYNCGLRINADLNGAINIAKRGIAYKKLAANGDYERWNIRLKSKSTKSKKITSKSSKANASSTSSDRRQPKQLEQIPKAVSST